MRVPNRAQVRRSPRVNVRNFYAWDVGSSYPAALALLYDADKAPTRELTGKGHKFNSSILSPQFQRNADGSYTDVGANPAVDVFDGEKWLRSCGAVTNLLPSGAKDLTVWGNTRAAVVAATDVSAYKLIEDATASASHFLIIPPVSFSSGSLYTISIEALRGERVQIGVNLEAGYVASASVTIFDIATENVLDLGGAASAAIEDLRNGWVRCTCTFSVIRTGTSSPLLRLVKDGATAYTGDGVSGIYLRNPQITATAYPVPYTPPGTTMPASNVTSTNGCWFTLADGSPVWKALSGEPLTLATRVRMGVGSEDVSDYSMHQVISCQNATASPHYYQGLDGDVDRVVGASDGVGYSTLTRAWPRNSIINRVTQVNTAGTQFRVGYMIEGTHTTIQWSSWVAYDGSFNPNTLYRLMLGYNNPYPMWYNKVAVWNKQMGDAAILEALK